MKQGVTIDQIAQAVDREGRIVRAIIKEEGGIFRTPEPESDFAWACRSGTRSSGAWCSGGASERSPAGGEVRPARTCES